MTLNDFVNMIHTDNADLKVFVFDCEEGRDEYRHGTDLSYLLFSVMSPYRLSVFLKDRFANAEVECCCPVDNNTMDVVIRGVQDADL